MRFDGDLQTECYLWLRATVPPGVEVCSNYRFLAPARKLELDVAVPVWKFGIEVDGLGAGHQWIKGWRRDREKDLEALCHGWVIARVATIQLRDGSGWDYLGRIVRLVSGAGAV